MGEETWFVYCRSSVCVYLTFAQFGDENRVVFLLSIFYYIPIRSFRIIEYRADDHEGIRRSRASRVCTYMVFLEIRSRPVRVTEG